MGPSSNFNMNYITKETNERLQRFAGRLGVSGGCVHLQHAPLSVFDAAENGPSKVKMIDQRPTPTPAGSNKNLRIQQRDGIGIP